MFLKSLEVIEAHIPRFFKFLISASFVCISDEKSLYNLMKTKQFPTTISCDMEHAVFLDAGQGKCYRYFAFSG